MKRTTTIHYAHTYTEIIFNRGLQKIQKGVPNTSCSKGTK